MTLSNKNVLKSILAIDTFHCN